jgi:hypothetical protein
VNCYEQHKIMELRSLIEVRRGCEKHTDQRFRDTKAVMLRALDDHIDERLAKLTSDSVLDASCREL